jgi:N-acetylmuramoyl-L-alanine amidase
VDASGRQHGFVMQVGGTPTQIDASGDPYYRGTQALGINDAGQIVGYFDLTFRHGFLRSATGTFTTIDYPLALNTEAWGINGSGQVVGNFCETTYNCYGGPYHGFLTTDAGRTFTTIDYPGGSDTHAYGVNGSGQVVGNYFATIGGLPPNWHGFLKDGGTFTTIDYPNAGGTGATGINNAGQIVGWFWDGSARHGFLARKPPIIAIDAGHGDNASCPPLEKQIPVNAGPTWGETESALALEIAKQVAANLNTRGYKAILTRISAYCETLAYRVLYAVNENAQLLVSIHLNAFSTPAERGTEVWYDPRKQYAASSLAAAKLIVNGQLGLGLPAHGTGANPPGLPGVKLANVKPPQGDGTPMGLLRMAKDFMPANLDEVAFLSNIGGDEAFLHDPANRIRIANVIADAIVRYFNSP